MKARVKLTGDIINVEPQAYNKEGEVLRYYDANKFNNIFDVSELDFNINEQKSQTNDTMFDWQSFRAEAAKDILCAIISRNPAKYLASIDFVVDQSVIAAGRLIESLNEKEKEEK